MLYLSERLPNVISMFTQRFTIELKPKLITMKHYTILRLTTLLFVFLTSQANAQKLADFKDCSDEKFTECIPFPRLYSEGSSIGKEVKRYKAIPSSLAYTTLLKQHTNLMKSLDAANDKIREAEDDAKDWAKDNPEATSNAYDSEIKSARSKAAEYDKKLIALFNKVEDSHEQYKRLYNARMGLRDLFGKVKRQLDYAEDHPKNYINKSSYEDDDDKVERAKLEELTEELEGYIASIRKHIVGQEGTHEDQEEAAEKGMDAMAELLQLQ